VKLDAKKRAFIKGLIAGKSMAQSARDAGYTETMAGNAGQKIMPAVREEFQRILAEHAPPSKLAETIAAGLDAEETEFAKFEGRITDERNVIAWGERRGYAELAAKIYGYTDSKMDVTHSGRIEYFSTIDAPGCKIKPKNDPKLSSDSEAAGVSPAP
jgi:hypothetical protein